MTIRLAVAALLLGLALAGCKPKPETPTAPAEALDCEKPTPRVPMRLLTRAEYNNALRDVLGDSSTPARDFPREPLANGWDNDGALNQVTDEHITRYLEAAESIAARAVQEHPDRLYACATRDQACGATFIATVGRRLFRRSLTAEETTAFTTFFNTTLDSADFTVAVELTLQVLLQSPQFLYRFERGQRPVPSMMRTALQPTELAERLSFFLWASVPDDTLLDAAESGGLNSVADLQAQATRMLADPRAHDAKLRFFSLWLRLDDVPNLEKNRAVYPQFSANLPGAWRTSLELYLSDVVKGQGTLHELLTSNALYVNDTMAGYVNTPQQPTFQKVSMPPTERAGLLTQPGLLARLASPDQSSPIRRGIFVLDKLMCQSPPPPPPEVMATPPAVNTGTTTRERFAQHTQDIACTSCHSQIDPLGFGFESYDGLGAFRTIDNGKPVDGTGKVTYAREKSLEGAFKTAPELANRLASSRQVQECFATEWMRFAMGRELGEGDLCSLSAVQEQFATAGNFDDLLMGIVTSQTFLTRPVDEVQP